MSLHYELTNEKKTLDCGTVVYRIRATRDLPHHNVKAGDLGGWVESTRNLIDEAWVADEAIVYGNALLSGWSRAFERAWVYEQAQVQGNAQVFGDAQVFGRAWIYCGAWVYERAQVFGDAQVYANAQVYGDALVCGHAVVRDRAKVRGAVTIPGTEFLTNGADISEPKHIMSFVVNTSHNLNTTLFRDSDNGHYISMACWSGTLDELEKMIERDKWIDTTGQDVLEARDEMRVVCQVFRERIKRWA